MSKRKLSPRWKGWTALAAVLGVGVALFSFAAWQETPILMYHFVGTSDQAKEDPLIVSLGTFEKHIQWLRRLGFYVYSLDEYYHVKSYRLKFQKKGVVLTFDDGNRDFAEKVVPVLEEERVPAANFIIWNNMLRREMGSMTVQQAREILESPFVTLGSHGLYHKELLGLDEKTLREEISDSKKFLEEVLGMPVLYFSYPGGHFDSRAREIVQESGYRLAFTTSRKRLEGRSSDLYSLPRVKISERDRNPLRFFLKAAGFQSLADKIRYRLLKFPSQTA